MVKGSRLKKSVCTMLMMAVMTGTCGCNKTKPEVLPVFEGAAVEQSDVYMEKIEGLNNSFIRGVDVSTYIAEKESGVKYYDFEVRSVSL